MVDINTIKPGDKVVWSGSSLYWPRYANGTFIDNITKDGDIVTVANPAVHTDSYGGVFVSVDLYPGAVVDRKPDQLRYHIDVENGESLDSQAKCTCDIMSLMRVGCKCGYMVREREAKT